MTNGRWKVKMKELLVVIVGAILLISTISSAETGAADYYNRQGMELSEEGRFNEANECFDTALWLIERDLADAPVMTTIDVSSKEAITNNSTFYIQEMSEGATLRFGLTNYNTVDMVIKPVYIDVLNYSPERVSNETRHYLGDMIEVEYYCSIRPHPKTYECEMSTGSNHSLSISPKEQGRLDIALKAEEEGVYLVAVGFEYEIGDKSKRYRDRQNFIIEFYDSKKRRDGWMGT